METSPFNPSLPGVRLLQSWIRDHRLLSIDVIGQERLEGRLVWQDSEFLALEIDGTEGLTLVSRQQICVIRTIG